MIEKVSDLLEKFVDEEIVKLKEYKLSHAPTIGEMYERLRGYPETKLS